MFGFPLPPLRPPSWVETGPPVTRSIAGRFYLRSQPVLWGVCLFLCCCFRSFGSYSCFKAPIVCSCSIVPSFHRSIVSSSRCLMFSFYLSFTASHPQDYETSVLRQPVSLLLPTSVSSLVSCMSFASSGLLFTCWPHLDVVLDIASLTLQSRQLSTATLFPALAFPLPFLHAHHASQASHLLPARGRPVRPRRPPPALPSRRPP